MYENSLICTLAALPAASENELLVLTVPVEASAVAREHGVYVIAPNVRARAYCLRVSAAVPPFAPPASHTEF